MYHYRESGLPHVWLENGYRERKTAHGLAVSIEDVDGLHCLIGRELVRKPKLTGAEFRFLRKELDLSQNAVGQLLGVSGQAVALWERHGRVPEPPARLLRVLYSEKHQGNAKIEAMLRELADTDRATAERLQFTHAKRWKLAA